MLVDDGLEILTPEACMELVATESVGRIAISVSALPAIFPVNFRLVNGDVVFLTGEGIKSQAAIEGAVVGFEVDQVDAEHRAGWSVMLIGQARMVTDEPKITADLRLSPWAGGARTNVVCIHPEFVSGRRIVASKS
ncbi:MAG TPA: pyridoxamine 5'-phosphate oxidase family protein [Acidimicrobiales bacterium]|nr:pyridoxamine 5'-phosphate oxidase family protein [Acidimicrobiales bacterium]